MQRSLSDKVSEPFRMLSFHGAVEEKTGRITGDVSPFMAPASRGLQKYLPDALLAKKLPVMTRPGQSLVNPPVFQSRPPHFQIGRTASLPTSRPQVGSPISRDAHPPESPGAQSQLTIFFAGAVCVYEDVSPEKAQAIISLARTSSSSYTSKTVTATKVESQPIRPSIDEGGCFGKNSSMISGNTKQFIKPAPTLVQAVAIPQARKASLARFLERRKERMIKVSPYGLNKSSPEVGGIQSGNLS